MSGAEKGNAAFLVQVLNRLGLNTDIAGALTVFAQLQRIYEGVDQLEGFTDGIEARTNLIGTAADAAGTNTLFARLAQLAGYTDTIEGVLGTNADAAAANASIWAMLKTINNSASAPSAAVKSVQRGNTSLGGPGYVDVTISAVNVAKTMINIPMSGNYAYDQLIRISVLLLNSTTIRVQQGGSVSVTVYWEVIEYN